MSDLYERDFYAWSKEQAALLRSGDFSRADITNIVEEIETLGRNEVRELRRRLTRLLVRLLKWRRQPGLRCGSWQLYIEAARDEVSEILADSPSLAFKLPNMITETYHFARREVAIETGFDLETFPPDCPWTFEQAMQEDV